MPVKEPYEVATGFCLKKRYCPLFALLGVAIRKNAEAFRRAYKTECGYELDRDHLANKSRMRELAEYSERLGDLASHPSWQIEGAIIKGTGITTWSRVIEATRENTGAMLMLITSLE